MLKNLMEKIPKTDHLIGMWFKVEMQDLKKLDFLMTQKFILLNKHIQLIKSKNWNLI